jgi:molybdopterin-guanine dinucleotide biosynthesis protein A
MNMKPPCVILAGGRSSRMGGADKALLPLQDRPLIGHILTRLSPQVRDIALNTNRPPESYRRFERPILPDTIPGFEGPLAGLLTGLLWSGQAHGDATHLLTAPCDTPFLPLDLVDRLRETLQRTGSDIVVACDEDRIHPVIGLWPIALAGHLADYLQRQRRRAMQAWMEHFRVATAEFPALQMTNLNTAQDFGLEYVGLRGKECHSPTSSE